MIHYREVDCLADSVEVDALVSDCLDLMDRTSGAAPYLNPPVRENFEKWIRNHFCVFAYDGNKLVAYSVLQKYKFPSYLAHVVKPTPLRDTAMMLFSVVDPNYRGLKIAKHMAGLRMNHAVDCGFKHVWATVHPDNAASKHLILSVGFKEVARGEIFESLSLRSILYKEIKKEA